MYSQPIRSGPSIFPLAEVITHNKASDTCLVLLLGEGGVNSSYLVFLCGTLNIQVSWTASVRQSTLNLIKDPLKLQHWQKIPKFR